MEDFRAWENEKFGELETLMNKSLINCSKLCQELIDEVNNGLVEIKSKANKTDRNLYIKKVFFDIRALENDLERVGMTLRRIKKPLIDKNTNYRLR